MAERALVPAFALVVALACFVGALPINARAQSSATPVKIDVVPLSRSIAAGDVLPLEIVLRDADNQPAAAPKNLTVEVRTVGPSGAATTRRVTLQAGQSATRLEVPVEEVGAASVEATHGELLKGGTIIYGLPPSSAARRTQTRINRSLAAPENVPQTRGVEALTRSANPATAAARAAPAAERRPVLKLDYWPQRRLLADGKDAAKVFVYVDEGLNLVEGDLEVFFLSSDGTLAPTPVVIEAGDFIGEAALTSTGTGDVRVKAVRAEPQAEIAEPGEVVIAFGPPITDFGLEVNPNEVSLLHRSQVVVELRDADGRPVATDRPRLFSLVRKQGQGSLEPVEIEIAPGQAVGRAEFVPSWPGEVSIGASTPGLFARSEDLTVTVPVVLLGLTAAGGLVGGLCARWMQGGHWWRLVLGAITGFILYWALAFGLVAIVAPAVALNPLTAFAVAVLGGWAGASVFTLLLERLPLPARRAGL